MSANGGTSWTTLQTYNVTGTSFSGVSQTFDLISFASSNTRIRFVSDGSSTRAGFYVDDVTITFETPCLPTPLAEWRFDEAAWTGSLDEVEDEEGGVLNGNPVGGVDTSSTAQICRSGSFDGVDDYIDVTGIDGHLADTASLSFWLKTTQVGNATNWLAPGVTGVEQSGGTDDIFWGFIQSTGTIGVGVGDTNMSVSTSSVNDDAWHHIVLTRDAGSGELKTYVDGALERTRTGATGTIGNGFSSLGRIEDTGGTPTYYQGNLDEVVIFQEVLSDAEVQAIYDNQTAANNWDGTPRNCPVAGVAFLLVEHDGSGINCATESITVRAMIDASTQSSSYAQQITLDTQAVAAPGR